MADNDGNSLRSMIMSFRVAELQMLLGFAGKSKSGKKNELQAQALELLKGRALTTSVQNKIRELHRQRYNNLGYLGSGAVGNSSDSCDSDMNINYGSVGGQMTTRSAANQASHALHLAQSQQQSSNHLLTNSASSSVSAINSNINSLSKHVNQQTAHQNAHQSHQRTDYYASMPRNIGIDYPSSKSYQGLAPNVQIPYPVYPDVRFKLLPFYDVLSELLKPSSLMPTAASRFQESTFTFHLTPQQANDVAMSREVQPGPKIEYSVQVQLRFCLLETSCEQDDNFPPSICVKVNSKMCSLPNPLPTNKPGVEPKRPSRPVNITALCRLSPTVSNQISISWAADYGRPYAVGVFLVRKLTSHTLLQRVKSKGVRNSDHTTAMIKEKLSHDPDSEIATMSLRGSLLCPLGKMRIQIPCRAITCAHVQCFDALLYLQMNEKKPTWICPVCDKPAFFTNLAIDGLFNDIIKEAPSSCNEVQFHEDGSWTPVVIKKENSCETLSLGARKTKSKRAMSPEQSEPKRQKVDVITIESSDDEADTESDNTKDAASISLVPSTTPVLSSGSGSESGTPNHIQSLPSPDSSSCASSNVQQIASHSNIPTSYYSNIPPLNSNTNSNSAVSSTSYNRSASVSTPSSTTNIGRTLVNAPSVANISSSYTNMPLLNPSFYSTNVTCFPDFLNSAPNSIFNYSNLDLNATFDHLFRQNECQNRETNYLQNQPNTNRRPPTDFDSPDIISID